MLKGLRPDFAKPDAVLLILDSTNLGRHLVLAAPILSLGLPTLIMLNMADDLAVRGGEVDVAALAAGTRRSGRADQRFERHGHRTHSAVPAGTAANLAAAKPARD